MAILSCSTVLGKWPQGQVPGPGEYSSIPVKLCKNPKCIASWTKRLRCSCHRSFNRRPIGSPRAWLARETERSKQHPVPTLQKLTIEVFAILVIVVDNQLPLVLLSVGEILSAKGGTNNVFCSVLSRLFWHGVFLPRLFSLLLLTPRLLPSQFSPFFSFFLYSQLSTAVSLILSSSVSSFWFFPTVPSRTFPLDRQEEPWVPLAEDGVGQGGNVQDGFQHHAHTSPGLTLVDQSFVG